MARVRVVVCPDVGPPMRFGVPRRQSGYLAACPINHLEIFVVERADRVEKRPKSPAIREMLT